MDLLFQQELNVILEEKCEFISKKEWVKMNYQACNSIRLCLAKDQKYFVMHETMAKDLSVENWLYLKKKLFKFNYKEGTSTRNHLDAYDKILADLRILDVEIGDEDKAFCLLNSLPNQYDHLSTTLLYDKKTITY